MGSLIQKNIKKKPVRNYSEGKQREWRNKSENGNGRFILKSLKPESVNSSDYSHPALWDFIIP